MTKSPAMRYSALLLLIAVLAGCASTPGARTSGDEEFGVVSGTFRGRWWNHYERGRSFLDGGFLKEASADLETALALRAEDQRWARTYGLHFIPEYFPNRELGIVRYDEGRLDEAARLLERSLSQERTALAAHYLDLVRAKQVSDAGGDSVPPVITAERVGRGGDARVRVRVSDNTFVASVVIDGEPHPMPQASAEVSFEAPVHLQSGVNRLDVTATDIAGNLAEEAVEIECDLDGPALAIASTDGGVVTGTIFDPAGVEAFQIGERPVTIAPTGDGVMHFEAAAEAGAAFHLVDTLGNETRGRIPVALGARAEARRVRIAANIGGDALGAYLAQATPGGGIRLANLAPGQRYLMDEIVVAVEADDPEGVDAISLDGVALTGIVPGAHTQFVSRRIRLDTMGPHTVQAAMTNAKGEVREAQVEIERAPTDIERPEERLRVALLGNLWEGAGPRLEDEADFVAAELTGALFKRGRMDVVSRDALPRVLEEQELRTVLGSRDIAPSLRQIVPADLLVVGKVRRTGETMEIVLQAVSSETSHILGYADVAGTAATLDDLRGLVRDLAVRFEQEFPQVTGLVASVASGERCFTTLTAADRVRQELPCVIYRFGEPIVHPETGAVLGRPANIIARGTLDEVQRQMSRMSYRAAEPVQVNDHVATR